jgi:mRNA-degrading endonuclease RelE of RelBE toxin-antitoxin system
MAWEVFYSSKATKQYKKIPEDIRLIMDLLAAEIELKGPVRRNWKNYSKLSDGSHHCHLTYRYVACWRETKKGIIVEVYHVSTREKAPY